VNSLVSSPVGSPAAMFDDRGFPVQQQKQETGWETALCVCPGERKDLQVMGMGVVGCRSERNQMLRKMDENLLMACTLGNADVDEITSLLRNRADVHAMRQPEGKTAMHLAAHSGAYNVVQALSAANADPDLVDRDDRTPLHVAALNGHANVVQFLLSEGKATPNMLDKNDQTALHFACIGGYLDVCGKLIEHKAYVEVDTVSNLQPLHFAALSGHTSIARLLLQHNADINCLCAEDLQSPLHCASSRGHAEVVQLLISKGAEVDIRNASHATPLHHAAMNNHIRVVERLLEAHANPLAVAKNNWTPMLMAFRQGHMECGRLLERTASNLKRRAAARNSQKGDSQPLMPSSAAVQGESGGLPDK